MSLFNHFAYLDAGTGSLIVQSIVGAAAGVAVFGRRLISRATLKVKGLFSRDEEKSTPSSTKE